MGGLKISSNSQDEPNHPYRCFLWQCCALSRGCGEEAQVVFREHERDNLNPADGVCLLRVLVNPRHLLREEEENHLLGWDGTSRSSSAFHLQPPRPSPPPPPSPPPSVCPVHSAHRLEQASVDRFENLNLKYSLPRSICLTDKFLLPFISLHVY